MMRSGKHWRSITGSTVQTDRTERAEVVMEERVYKIMNGAGAMNIAVGVVTLVTGIVCGTLLLIGGAKLLAGKSKVLF